jgi:hypothetical protein
MLNMLLLKRVARTAGKGLAFKAPLCTLHYQARRLRQTARRRWGPNRLPEGVPQFYSTAAAQQPLVTLAVLPLVTRLRQMHYRNLSLGLK